MSMANKTYSELLKDPKWQKKRLEMLQSSGFKCESCGDTEETLHIHHVYYEKDCLPWDYPDNAYLVLCSRCHEKWHTNVEFLQKSLCKMTVDQLNEIVTIITQFKMMGPTVTHMFFELISGYHWVQFEKNKEEDF